MDPLEIIPFLDLTTLGSTDQAEDVEILAERAMEPFSANSPIHCAALCVWPNFAELASKLLTDSPVKLACVAAAFPDSQAPLEVKCREVEIAVAQGADEIDIAINRGLFLSGNIEESRTELKSLRQACGSAHLKVILETCDLADKDVIRQACDLALECGADFLKTSTGKGSHGATLEHTQILLEAASDGIETSGRSIGVKPAGGIRTYEEAKAYLALAKEFLPSVSPANFRLGASSLLDDLLGKSAG